MENKINSIDGSTLIPLDNLSEKIEIEKIKEISLKKELYVHCKSGERAKKAILILKKYGIYAKNITGGIDAWLRENYSE